MSFWNRNLPSRTSQFPGFYGVSKEMNDFFNPFLEGFSANSMSVDSFMPKLEIKEAEKNYQITAELPGMREEDIHVTLKDNNLVIEGEKKKESKKEEKGYYHSELNYGSFYRSIPLTAEIDAEKIAATYKNGMLTVTLEKAQTSLSKSRKITVKKD